MDQKNFSECEGLEPLTYRSFYSGSLIVNGPRSWQLLHLAEGGAKLSIFIKVEKTVSSSLLR